MVSVGGSSCSRRNRSRWYSGTRPAYSLARMNDGLVTTPSTPRPTARPWTRCVLPAPKGPSSRNTSPAAAAAPSRSPSATVCGGVWVVIRKLSAKVGDPPVQVQYLACVVAYLDARPVDGRGEVANDRQRRAAARGERRGGRLQHGTRRRAQ